MKRWRPVPAGVSIGHYRLNLNGKPASGTLGGWVQDTKTGEILMMSCWHVLANCGDCKKGDPIVQPGPLDGGRHPQDTIGYLERWVDVEMIGVDLIEAKKNLEIILRNKAEPHFDLVDAAFAKPISRDIVSPEVLGVGIPKGVEREIKIGDETIGSGRSGIIEQKVSAIKTTMFVNYYKGVALFKDCVIVTPRNSKPRRNRLEDFIPIIK